MFIFSRRWYRPVPRIGRKPSPPDLGTSVASTPVPTPHARTLLRARLTRLVQVPLWDQLIASPVWGRYLIVTGIAEINDLLDALYGRKVTSLVSAVNLRMYFASSGCGADEALKRLDLAIEQCSCWGYGLEQELTRLLEQLEAIFVKVKQ